MKEKVITLIDIDTLFVKDVGIYIEIMDKCPNLIKEKYSYLKKYTLDKIFDEFNPITGNIKISDIVDDYEHILNIIRWENVYKSAPFSGLIQLIQNYAVSGLEIYFISPIPKISRLDHIDYKVIEYSKGEKSDIIKKGYDLLKEKAERVDVIIGWYNDILNTLKNDREAYRGSSLLFPAEHDIVLTFDDNNYDKDKLEHMVETIIYLHGYNHNIFY